MKIIKIDHKLNEIIILVNNLDDLWHLEKVIAKGDIIYGSTDRKIKPKTEGEKAIRIKLFVELEVNEASFSEFSEKLKISGVILSGKPEEYIDVKSHQSIDVGIGEKLKIKKTKIQSWQIDRLKKAEKESSSNGLLTVLMDDEEAQIAFINQFEIKKKATIKSKKSGKMYAEEKSNYFEEINDKINQLSAKKIILCGPGFTKDNFKKYLEDKHNNKFEKIITTSLNSTGETGFRELVNSNKLSDIEKDLELNKEGKLIEEFLEKLSKGLADYGVTKIKDLINQGAVDKLIVSEKYLVQNRDSVEEILNMAEKFACKIHIISSKNPNEKTIYGMGGIVAILRYKVE
jgi:protein pelota